MGFLLEPSLRPGVWRGLVGRVSLKVLQMPLDAGRQGRRCRCNAGHTVGRFRAPQPCPGHSPRSSSIRPVQMEGAKIAKIAKALRDSCSARGYRHAAHVTQQRRWPRRSPRMHHQAFRRHRCIWSRPSALSFGGCSGWMLGANCTSVALIHLPALPFQLSQTM